MAGMSIGELARRAGVRVANIRFYEEKGLLPSPARRQSGHRSYGSEDVGRLNFIRTSRELGFSLDQIHGLLRLARPDNLSCDEAISLSREQLGTVRQRISELRTIEAALLDHIAQCSAGCCSGRVPACPILPEGV